MDQQRLFTLGQPPPPAQPRQAHSPAAPIYESINEIRNARNSPLYLEPNTTSATANPGLCSPTSGPRPPVSQHFKSEESKGNTYVDVGIRTSSTSPPLHCQPAVFEINVFEINMEAEKANAATGGGQSNTR